MVPCRLIHPSQPQIQEGAHLSLGVNLLGHNGNSQDGRMNDPTDLLSSTIVFIRHKSKGTNIMKKGHKKERTNTLGWIPLYKQVPR